MTKIINYEEPLEISKFSFISSLTINQISPRIYEGKVVCRKVSEDGGRFTLGWHAKRIRAGYEINPISREGIELCGMLGDTQFTHSRDFDGSLREYISQ